MQNHWIKKNEAQARACHGSQELTCTPLQSGILTFYLIRPYPRPGAGFFSHMYKGSAANRVPRVPGHTTQLSTGIQLTWKKKSGWKKWWNIQTVWMLWRPWDESFMCLVFALSSPPGNPSLNVIPVLHYVVFLERMTWDVRHGHDSSFEDRPFITPSSLREHPTMRWVKLMTHVPVVLAYYLY